MEINFDEHQDAVETKQTAEKCGRHCALIIGASFSCTYTINKTKQQLGFVYDLDFKNIGTMAIHCCAYPFIRSLINGLIDLQR